MDNPILRAAYLGPEGTFSHFAARTVLGHTRADLRPCPDLPAVFEAVEQGQCDIGVVPLENSLRGTVGQSFDLFLKHQVTIIGELYEAINHCLLGGTAQAVEEIRTVFSHPQPLAQCGQWLRANLPGVSMQAVDSTAAAARKALEAPGLAAIGHKRLAELYGLSVLRHGIEDEADNWTRFVIIAREPDETLIKAALPPACADAPRERTSLLFTVPDRPGSLAAVLNALAEADVNMRKLESRPLRHPDRKNWKSAFFVDVECDMTAPAQAAALGTLCARTTMLRVLGSYPRGPYLAEADDAPAASL